MAYWVLENRGTLFGFASRVSDSSLIWSVQTRCRIHQASYWMAARSSFRQQSGKDMYRTMKLVSSAISILCYRSEWCAQLGLTILLILLYAT